MPLLCGVKEGAMEQWCVRESSGSVSKMKSQTKNSCCWVALVPLLCGVKERGRDGAVVCERESNGSVSKKWQMKNSCCWVALMSLLSGVQEMERWCGRDGAGVCERESSGNVSKMKWQRKNSWIDDV